MFVDTISAIATPLGQGGLGVVRISGPHSKQILRKICKCPRNILSHKAVHSWAKIVSRETILIDEVVYTFFKSPKSFTGEDVVEVACHGGGAVLKTILDETIRLGARLADRGEFTKRAFLNGKLDLAQAEAVLGLIKAKNTMFAVHSAKQLKGHFSDKINGLYNQAMGLIASLESEIDFPDEISAMPRRQLLKMVNSVILEINKLLKTSDIGRVMRDGVRTAIVGAPNVGKSTLLNVLLGEERSIVTDIPGTTRDVIEETIDLGDVVLVASDTAGIRASDCKIERAGIARSQTEIDRAELVLFVLDASKGASKADVELLSRMKNKRVIIVKNKIDLLKRRRIRASLFGKPVFETCLLSVKGIDKLRKGIVKSVLGKGAEADNLLINSRHKECLERAKFMLQKCLESINIKVPVDFVVIDLRGAVQALGEITGKQVSEKIIDKIFSEFCVGK